MVANEAYSGRYNKNPFRFQDFGLTTCSLNVEGKQMPHSAINCDMGANNWIEPYFSYIKNCGLYPYDWGNGVTKQHFTDGLFILGFDLTFDDSGEGVAYWSPRWFGTVNVHLRFKQGLSETVTLLAFATFDNTVSIDANQAVSFDYTV